MRYGLGDVPRVLNDPRVEYLYAPNGHYRRLGKRIEINSFSMRADPFPERKASPTERRVMVIGDSIINGGSMLDQPEIVTSVLQRELRSRLKNQSIIVGNISAGSWGPQNQLAYIERFGLLDADAAVLVVSSHDATDEIGPLRPGRAQNSPDYALAWSEVFDRWVKQPRTAAERPPGPPGRAEPCLTAFEEMLSRIERDTGHPAIVVFHYERDELDAAEEPAGLTQFRAACQRHDIEPIAMRDAYRAQRDAGTNVYQDYIHLNATGERVIADALLPSIEAVLRSAAATPAPSTPETRP